jgi:hypothetical protein
LPRKRSGAGWRALGVGVGVRITFSYYELIPNLNQPVEDAGARVRADKHDIPRLDLGDVQDALHQDQIAEVEGRLHTPPVNSYKRVGGPEVAAPDEDVE